MKIKTDFWLTALAFASQDIFALDFLLEPDFSIKERYEDNLRLQEHPPRDNWITTVSPGLMLGYIAENNELKSNFKWNELIYHGESALDFSEKLGNISHQFKGERFKTDLSASYSEQSSLTTQLDETGSGDLRIQLPRFSKSISPNLTYSLSEKNSLQLGYSYSDVSFENVTGQINNSLNFADYTYEQFFATISHAYTERLSFNLSGSYSIYESSNETPGIFITSGLSQSSTTLNYQAGVQYLFDEKTQLAFSAGIRDTETESVQFRKVTSTGDIFSQSDFSQNTMGHVFSANFSRGTEWGSFGFNAGQQLNPASTGNQQTTTTFSARLFYNLSERLSTGINASYLQAEAVSTLNNSNISNNRTLTSLSPTFKWRWSDDMNLEFSYSFRQQNLETSNQTAIADSVQLQFSYQPQINRQVK